MSNKNIIILGAGFSSLAAACHLAKSGYEVHILEKNEHVGGRARQMKKDGFIFDMGPTFYWMPDVFETFFQEFGKSVGDYYQLKKLNPAYQVYFGIDNNIAIGDNLHDIANTFEHIEKGAGLTLKQFINKAAQNYHLVINDLVYKPGENLGEIINLQTMRKVHLFLNNIKSQVAGIVKDERLQRILEFPVLFLGAKAAKTPAFYNFMNYADFGLGTWHPVGGMSRVAEALKNLATELGVKITTGSEVISFKLEHNQIRKVITPTQKLECDILLSGADYAHTESLLPYTHRQYSKTYWNKKTFAPSALLFYIAFNCKLKNLAHHTLFFDTDFSEHERAIYENQSWPAQPLFYLNAPSISDNTFAPPGKEAVTCLIPLAPGLDDTPAIRAQYFDKIIHRMEKLTRQSLNENILFYESYCINDFIDDYHAYKGNAYGLANTLFQTHYFRPKLKSRKVNNLYFTGQLTVPGAGLPPSLISGKIVSELIKKYHSTN